MKIGMLTERMLLGFGVDLVVHEQARRLGGLGHDVSVFVMRADPSAKGDHYGLHVLSDAAPDVSDYSSPSGARKLLQSIRAEDFDVWILHTPPFYGWIRFLERPVVLVEYGSPPSHFFNVDVAYGLWKMVSEHFRNNFSFLRSSDAIVSISHDIHSWLPESVQRYSKVALLGADHYESVDRQSALAFRRSIGVDEGECLILWVGRMQFAADEQPYKGFLELREVLPDIKTIAPHVKVALLGKVHEKERQHLDALGVIALPNHPASEMGVAYAAADVLLNLSKWEGFNLALVEAQYQGTPVVAYDVGPHSEITCQGVTAILIKSADEIVPALTCLVEDVKLRQDMSEKCRNFVQGLTWDRNVAQINLVLQNCCDLYNTAPPALRAGDLIVPPASPPRPIERLTLDRILSLNGCEFVAACYHTLLLRHPDPGGELHFLGRLQSGARKIRILFEIAQSEEGQRCNSAPRRLRFYIRFGRIGWFLAPHAEVFRRGLRAVVIRGE
ncbi:glycosyltransferase [Variovorax sp. dw_954]|uniref:glycosyltransferase n=1 Tax=Variovorax sp. dw_954 TaxID=2720078 RepID=UPI001BD2166A|nr:glycosyltransferase [Variovorax sp. dw_954]